MTAPTCNLCGHALGHIDQACPNCLPNFYTSQNAESRSKDTMPEQLRRLDNAYDACVRANGQMVIELHELREKCKQQQKELATARDLIAHAMGDGDEVVRRLREALMGLVGMVGKGWRLDRCCYSCWQKSIRVSSSR